MHTAGAADEVVNSFIPVVTAVVGSTWMSGLRLRVVIVGAAVGARCVALVQIYNSGDEGGSFRIHQAIRTRLRL